MILNNDICRVYTDFPKTGHIYVHVCWYFHTINSGRIKTGMLGRNRADFKVRTMLYLEFLKYKIDKLYAGGGGGGCSETAIYGMYASYILVTNSSSLLLVID